MKESVLYRCLNCPTALQGRLVGKQKSSIKIVAGLLMLLSLLCCNYPSAVAAALPLLNFSSGSAATNNTGRGSKSSVNNSANMQLYCDCSSLMDTQMSVVYAQMSACQCTIIVSGPQCVQVSLCASMTSVLTRIVVT